MDFLPCRYSPQFLVDREDRIFSYFLRCQSLFISRGVDDVEEHPSLSGAREGEVCMKYKDHHTRHPRGHLGDRASAQGARGCAWRDDQFGRGQNPVLGWSDPTFAHGSVAKVTRGSLQPNKNFFGARGENLDEAGEESTNYVLQLRLHHLLLLVNLISLGETRK